MKKVVIGFWYSLPIQLFLLHFRRYQIFLIFWYVLFATVGGSFMETFGADSLFLAPEYFNEVNFFSTAIVGVAVGVFIMSWHITTFILHRKHIQFLATTAQPFLKFCINNSVLPLIFLLYYLFTAIHFDAYKELMDTWQIVLLVGGFITGLLFAIIIAFIYFFGADKTIYRSLKEDIHHANFTYATSINNQLPQDKHKIRIEWFLSAKLSVRKPRDVRHYSQAFLDSIFKRHHFAAIIAFFIAFVFLVAIGFIGDTRLFQIPAAGSITIFFALLIAVGGAMTIFLKNWSIPVVLLIYVGLNYLYQQNIINPANKAYGLNYWNKNERPAYTQENVLALASRENIETDKQAFLQRLIAWKKNQPAEKPILYIINTSGGGLRSATFTFNVLQQLDSAMNGRLMQNTLLINGASGGLLGAAYFRELYLQKTKNGRINLQDKQYVNDIAKDLLNPLFSSFVSRDIIGPVQKFNQNNFEYTKDRGYAFEQKLNENTRGYLNKTVQDYYADEHNATIPTLFYNSVITRDGRKMILCTQPVRFLMKPTVDSNTTITSYPDAIDFNSFFSKQNSANIKVLSALRMNATFPYVLPNVWLPSNPVIDVMDAGLRDNFGQENSLRFISVFKDWLQANTSKVVIIQIRDRSISDWDKPYDSKSLISMFTKPAFLLQHNWFKLQDYYQNDQLAYLNNNYGSALQKVCFQYIAAPNNKTASLSFHLTAREKSEIAASLQSKTNQTEMQKIQAIMQTND